MKYKTLLFLIPVLIILSCSNDEVNSDNYYDLINNAEYTFLKGDTIRSIDYYDKAFDLTFTPFAKDLFNAILLKRKKSINDSGLVEKIVFAGISKEYLNCALSENGDLKECNYDSFQSELQGDTTYTNFIDSLFYLDQYWRLLDFEKDNTGYNDYRKEISEADMENGKVIINYLRKIGYPSEKKQGFKYIFHETDKSPLYFLLLHQLNEDLKYDLAPIIRTAMSNGNLHPELGGQLLERFDLLDLGLAPSLNVKFIFEDEFPDYNNQEAMEYFFLNSPTYRQSLSDSTILEYNKNRQGIGIAKVDIFEYMYKSRSKVEGFKYIYNDIDIYSVRDSSTFKTLSANMVKL